MQYNTVQCIVQCSVVFSRAYSSLNCWAVFSAVKCRAMHYSVQYSALRSRPVKRVVVQYIAVQYRLVQCSIL